ncbi:MAG: hypothetical protein B7733_05065 [Myxococcales bacterium FL481]|nr:MAG: hypothetical protein B7733_05065 [Myxococcales bacterium FL481]
MHRSRSMYALSALLVAAACGQAKTDNAPKKPLAQKADKLEIAKPKQTAAAHDYTIETKTANVGFMMEAPVEKIRGKVPGSATTGELTIDLTDVRKSAGLVHVDLSGLELFQRKAEDGKFGEETKNDMQNEHARAWLEIDDSAPAEQRKKNALVEFSLTRVLSASANNVLEMTGPERKILIEAEGDFLLHQRKSRKKVKLEATFAFAGDVPQSVHVKTVEPLGVDLAEHDVRPRTAFGKLAQKTLSAMSEKVAQVAEIELEFTAQRKGKTLAAK